MGPKIKYHKTGYENNQLSMFRNSQDIYIRLEKLFIYKHYRIANIKIIWLTLNIENTKFYVMKYLQKRRKTCSKQENFQFDAYSNISCPISIIVWRIVQNILSEYLKTFMNTNMVTFVSYEHGLECALPARDWLDIGPNVRVACAARGLGPPCFRAKNTNYCLGRQHLFIYT